MGSGLYLLLGPVMITLAIDSAYWNQYAIESLVEVCPMEVYETRRDGTVATHGVDLTNATGVDALVAEFEERYLAEAPRLAFELLEGMRTSFFDCAWAQWTGGRVAAPAERGSVEPFADGCVPFLTAPTTRANGRGPTGRCSRRTRSARFRASCSSTTTPATRSGSRRTNTGGCRGTCATP
jgi:hypothetical protein